MADPEERLIRLLQSVNEWLKFAETKNGGITAISGLGATAALTYLTDLKDPSRLESWGLGTACLLFVLSVILAVLSFFPQTDPTRFLSQVRVMPEVEINLYYFGHLASLTGARLAAHVLDVAGVADRQPSPAEQQIADQVVVNSRITQHKLRLFSLAARCFLAAVVLSSVVILMSRTIWE